jgi:predicted ATP-grasp superfamily ATP-dependent carboligase
VKHYAKRRPWELDEAGGYYCRHVAAMTEEGLHSKADIAAELGWRDMQIDRLHRVLEEKFHNATMTKLEELTDRVVAATTDPTLDELVKLREANAALVRKLGVANARIKVEEDKRKKYRAEQDRYRTKLLESEARNAKLMGELREAEERLRRALEREAAGWAK